MHPFVTRATSRLLALACAILLVGAAKHKRTLEQDLDHAIKSTPALQSAFFGMQAVRLRDGKVLYQHNQDHLFVPASNTKLFTSALALLKLGPDYRFTTSVVAERPVDADGILQGDLIFVGRGDPSMSGRAYPYSVDPVPSRPLQAIEDLADQVVSGGLRTVRGDIVGDDTRYPWQPYPSGWSVGDIGQDYGAPVSALIIADNRLDVVIRPGPDEGGLAEVQVLPQIQFFTIDNQIRTVTGARRAIHSAMRPALPELRLWGTIPPGDSGAIDSLALADPAEFAAAVLRDALIRRGVNVTGRATARHRFLDRVDDPERGLAPATPATTGVELARRISPPLAQLLQVVDKVSQNLHAEVMLREAGAVRRNMGTAAAGLAELRGLLAEAKISDDQYVFADGSGLSRSTLVEPQAVTALLAFMYRSELRDRWMALLPVGGRDGSLRTRFKGHPEAAAIHAKTGSLSHVRALSGYAESARDGVVAFSLLLNNYAAPDTEIVRFLDTIGLRLL